jgi:hypothetical protein
VDKQPSRPVLLTINGRDAGLYRWMPAKDAEWVEKLAGVEAVDLIDGPAARVLAGDRSHHEADMAMLLGGAPLDSLAAHFDVKSLIDLACCDVYTGRVDADINVRCWREKGARGRWRWVLFDLDLWAPTEENSVLRMCTEALPEAPYLKIILDHPGLSRLFLARYAVLMNTTFAPEQVLARLDQLSHRDAALLAWDHVRWGGTLALPPPEQGIALLRRHALQRPSTSLSHLVEHTGRELVRLDVEVSPRRGGVLWLEGSPAGDGFSGRLFEGIPVHVTAIPAEGMEFAGWKGMPGSGPEVIVRPGEVRKLKALFRPGGSGRDLP